jgi:hypothetical protein
MRRYGKPGGIGLILVILLFTNAFAADVEVYLEGTYSEDRVDISIYADINGPDILSFGVKLTYATSELTIESAEKNEAIWFLRDGTNTYAYMDPDTTTPGEVVIIGAKLDTTDPTAGVSGARILLGKASFTRTESSMPFTPTLSVTYGKTGGYKNFVATDGTVLDGSGVSFIQPILCECDLNHDRKCDMQDWLIFGQDWGRTDCNEVGAESCECDLNDDGTCDMQDWLDFGQDWGRTDCTVFNPES